MRRLSDLGVYDGVITHCCPLPSTAASFSSSSALPRCSFSDAAIELTRARVHMSVLVANKTGRWRCTVWLLRIHSADPFIRPSDTRKRVNRTRCARSSSVECLRDFDFVQFKSRLSSTAQRKWRRDFDPPPSFQAMDKALLDLRRTEINTA